MCYINVDDFKLLLGSDKLEEIVRKHVFSGIPYVFKDSPTDFDVLRTQLCSALSLQPENIDIVGSAKTGFSLSPDNFPRRFSTASDIDVVVVDDRIFDLVWSTLLSWHYPRRASRLRGKDESWCSHRRWELYWGWFEPDRIRYEGLSYPRSLLPIKGLSYDWFNAFQSLGRHPAFASRKVTGRLYRSWEHALLYHVEGLRQIAERPLTAP